MKILFCYEKIENRLKKEILTELGKLKSITVKDYQIQNLYESFDLNEILELERNFTSFVMDTDLVIWECSKGNELLGLIFQTSKKFKKPLFLIESTLDQEVAVDHSKPNWVFYFYRYQPQNVGATINSIIKKVNESVNKKLILIIPHEIRKYLDWKKDNKTGEKSKADIVRNAVIRMMSKDKDYLNEVSK